MEQSKGQFNSNFGFLMAALGSAVGLGNLWSFPYKMGLGGGFAFLLLYNAMTGNRLSQADGSAPSIQMSYILCKTPEEYEDAVALCSADHPPYTYEELQQFIGPDATFEAVKEFAQKFSLEDLRARAGK